MSPNPFLLITLNLTQPRRRNSFLSAAQANAAAADAAFLEAEAAAVEAAAEKRVKEACIAAAADGAAADAKAARTAAVRRTPSLVLSLGPSSSPKNSPPSGDRGSGAAVIYV